MRMFPWSMSAAGPRLSMWLYKPSWKMIMHTKCREYTVPSLAIVVAPSPNCAMYLFLSLASALRCHWSLMLVHNRPLVLWKIIDFEDNADHQAAAGADSNVFAIT